jgi:hypothetical protein
MATSAEGRSAGASLEIKMPIEISGIDGRGFQFFDQTQTLSVTRHGAKIKLKRMLVAEQELLIRNISNGREADARVLGHLESKGDGQCYVVKFLDEKVDVWGIVFPDPVSPAGAISCVLLECSGCKTREVSYLDHFELELLETNGRLSRNCPRCRDASLWGKASGEAPVIARVAAPAAAERKERRREPRRELRIKACVRSPRFGEDLVTTRSTSRQGLSFTSSWDYVPGEHIEIAVPYSGAGGNIFMNAKIVRLQLLTTESVRLYGVHFE